MSSQKGNDGSQKQNNILVDAGIQATLLAIKHELDDGATLEEIKEIVDGLLYFAEGKRIQ